VSLQRNRRQGRFTDVDKRRLAPVIPHLLRSLHMRSLMGPLRQQQGAYLSAIDRMPFGVIFIDDTGRVFDVSVPAEEILQNASELTIKHRKLLAQNSSDDAALQQLIRASITTNLNETAVSKSCTLRRLNGKQPFKIVVISASSDGSCYCSYAGCAVVIFDPREVRARAWL